MKEIIYQDHQQEHRGYAQFVNGVLWVQLDGKTFTYDFLARDRRSKKSRQAQDGEIRSQLPGRVVKILIEAGWEVDAHTPVVILETMKMEYTLLAQKKGVVSGVFCHEGALIGAGQPLVAIS